MPSPVLSVLIPAYNEQATIETCIRRVEAEPTEKEILVVDDGSTDGTRDILARLAQRRSPETFRVLTHELNAGKGRALRTAIAAARGEITLVQDADLEYDPSDYPALLAPIREGRADVVYGSRRLCRENDYPVDRFLVGSLALTFVANVLYGCQITDMPTCYKVFRTSLLQSIPLTCEGFEFCPEVTAKVAKLGHRIVEVPIHYRRRSVAEGKKITWRDGAIGLWTLARLRVSR